MCVGRHNLFVSVCCLLTIRYEPVCVDGLILLSVSYLVLVVR